MADDPRRSGHRPLESADRSAQAGVARRIGEGPHHAGRRAVGPLARRPDVGGLRARSHHPGAGRGGRRSAASGPAHHDRHRRPVGHPGVLVPPGDRRLPDGRRGLRRLPGQLRRPHQPRRRRVAGRRLHADRGRLHRGGRRLAAVRLPEPGRRHHPALPRDPPLHHGAQPARPRRDGSGLPAADHAVHRRPAGHHRHRPHPSRSGSTRRSWGRPSCPRSGSRR